MTKATTKALDTGQLEMMWNFLRMGHQKPNIAALKENCDLLRQMMIQKTAGQRKDDPQGYADFGELPTVINCIVIEAMCLYLSGELDKLKEVDGGD